VIRKAVEEADPFLTVIGPHWLSLSTEKGGRRIDQLDDWVAKEPRIALQREIPIIPVPLDGTPWLGVTSFHTRLRIWRTGMRRESPTSRLRRTLHG
jgi:hypothetical protein